MKYLRLYIVLVIFIVSQQMHAKSLLSKDETKCVTAIRKQYPKMATISDIREEGRNPSEMFGLSSEIVFIKKQNPWGIAFSRGSGDCAAGCIFNENYFYTCDKKTGHIEAIDESIVTKSKAENIQFWAIPRRFPSIAFANLKSLVEAAHSEKWWIRDHALYVLSQTLDSKQTSISFSEDSNSHLKTLQQEAQSQKASVLGEIEKLTHDSDKDISRQAKSCVKYLKNLETIDKLTYLEGEKKDDCKPYKLGCKPKFIYSLERTNCFK